ncbi:MAG: excinuclease ABC subunit B [Candidatus Sungbacteria bacterium RIFCSPLOWO2_12_FULL_41_11]|uniref:UvrABC system protein B n=1 Tax=Candidatus Sungbacteria bacterium RIFCSPLOWO2_12_FULL_41_11 TaxID=1802286 RepID=A0A1G2LTJ4_9BACT|nr:MAG: excinuclease ABC subunit B [Candidatus Sungbacteria bacterium RIFCSPLOWO2_12_FULL_41_11]
MPSFKLVSKFKPMGDQPQAIEKLVANLDMGVLRQTLLGVTGSGKTFTMANVIERVQKPTLVISHNKTLAAQLYQEFKEFFPESAMHYFVSYYDYYQPEAYIPSTDTYIEKDAKINELIDGLRHASTASLLTRNDVIIVASVSCIYGIGDPEEYEKVANELKIGQKISPREVARYLVLLQYHRNDFDPRQGEFRIRGDMVEIHSPSGEEIIVVEFSGNSIEKITVRKVGTLNPKPYTPNPIKIFPAKHFVTPRQKLELAIKNIKQEAKERVAYFKKSGKLLEAQRLAERTNFDMEMLKETGYCNGIENYSRHLSFREPGSPPYTLIDYFNYAYGQQGDRDSLGVPVSKNWLCFIDESHATVPQLRGMYEGDFARKKTLVEYGFRLPSAIDNRPLKFPEFNKKVGPIIYVSATPADYELKMSVCKKLEAGSRKSEVAIAEQLIRPTGLLDPKIEVRKTAGQIKDVIREIKKRVAKKERSLVLALTKRLAEDIAEYLAEAGIKTTYLHSEIKTLDRPEILKGLRLGNYDAVVGINLLREGLDLPEVSFIAILDADKEGFLRNERTLLQITGRAARHLNGEVIMYADTVTDSMKRAMGETERRRQIQADYNAEHSITPQQIQKEIRKSLLEEAKGRQEEELAPLIPQGPKKDVLKALEREMKRAAKEMNFELAARIRDQIKKISKP